jgi:hypothetical protein
MGQLQAPLFELSLDDQVLAGPLSWNEWACGCDDHTHSTDPIQVFVLMASGCDVGQLRTGLGQAWGVLQWMLCDVKWASFFGSARW